MATGEMYDLDLGDEVPTRGGGGGSFLDVEGKFHCQVLSLETEPQKANGQLMTTAFCRLNFIVLGGPQEAIGKQGSFILWNTSLEKSEKTNAWAKKKIFFMLCAIGVHDENNGPKIKINKAQLSKVAIGRQFVCKMAFERNDDGSFKLNDAGYKNLQLCYADLWHVDDPAAQDVVNQGALLEYPPALRRKPESFSKPVKSTASAGAGAASAASGSATTGRPNSTTTGKPPAMPSATAEDDPLAGL